VQVGTFYYVWYDPNLSVSWEYPKIADKSVLGYYNSCNPEIVATHLKWISELGINFIILSYWGHYFLWDEWYSFQLNATHQVFEVAKENITNVKVCVMIEPFNRTQNPTYNYQEVYDHIYENFVVPYPTVYFNYLDRPLLSFFNDPHLTPQGSYPKDDRFSMLIIGSDSYADWIYTDLIPAIGPMPRNRQICVTPRFDDSRFRTPPHVVDKDLCEGVYGKQWKRAIDYVRRGVVDVISICSWNEYPERTAIEPHYDSTAWNPDPYYLYNKTRNFIEELRGRPTDCGFE